MLSWANVSVTVKNTPLVENISGKIDEGQMMAIIGGSGAGKTTLLNVLGNRNLQGKQVTGHILFNGRPRNNDTWRKQTAYVEQDDILHLYLTVRETWTFHARLTMPNISVDQRDLRILQVAEDLHLGHALDRPVGVLSGGEKKRVSIGSQLLSLPKVLLLDEPTSGLDSFTALGVVTILKQLVTDRNMIVVMTIHQPRENIVELLDVIYCIKAGKVIFNGHLNEAYVYFAQLGKPIPEHMNPADFLLDISNNQETPTFPIEPPSVSSINTESLIAEDYQKGPTIATQMGVLVSRNMLNLWRDRRVLLVSLAQMVVLTIVIGFVFFRLGYNQASVQSRYGVLFFILINQAFSSAMPLVTTFPLEKKLIVRDYNSGLYAPWVAFVARFITQWTILFITTTTMAIVLFYMINLNGLLVYYVTLILTMTAALMTGLAIGASSSTPQMAQAVAPTVMILLILVSGLYTNRATIPVALAWIKWISFMAYAYTILVVNEFTGKTYECSPDVSVCYKTGEQVITIFGMNEPPMWANFAGMIGCILVTASLGMGFLTWTIRMG